VAKFKQLASKLSLDVADACSVNFRRFLGNYNNNKAQDLELMSKAERTEIILMHGCLRYHRWVAAHVLL